MTRDEILGATSMPLANPSYPKGPFRFIHREYLLIHYETDPDVLRAFLPEPLEPDGNDVYFEWMKMPDSSGFGDYDEERVAMGTMEYKAIPLGPARTVAGMKKLNVNLKFIPDVDGSAKIAQLVGYYLEDIDLRFAYTGEARLHLVPHANCRIADLPIRKIHYGQHLCADLTLPYGKVLHDYMVEAGK